MSTNIACLRASKGKGGHGRRLARLISAYEVTPNYRPAKRLNPGCLVVNYGVGTTPIWDRPDLKWINHPTAVCNSADKRLAFRCFDNYGVPTLDWSRDQATACEWLRTGHTVYARTIVQGSKGAGVVVVSPGDKMVPARLYTKGFPVMYEFRVHVGGGKALDVVQKKRMGKDKRWLHGLEAVDMAVRNYNRGWVFAHQDLDLTVVQRTIIEDLGVRAAEACGLDWGAADILMGPAGDMVVCEMNSAPALEADGTWSQYQKYFGVLRNEANP